MSNETVSAVRTIHASAEVVFAVLADPRSHGAIDGTGWVGQALDDQPLTKSGQLFGMAMYHDNHPDKHYTMVNKVRVCAPPRSISWEPGQYVEDGDLEFGGWIWHYALAPIDKSLTEVTLTFDWSRVPQLLREQIQFPPFALDHLDNSLSNLAGIAASQKLSST